MAVYRRGYQRYRGPYTGHRERLLAFPRFAWRRLMEQRLVVIALVAAFFWPLGCAVYIYVANNLEVLRNIGAGASLLPPIDSQFFVYFMNVQGTAAVILAALAGPGLVAPDLANQALPLYFSRPLSRLDYVLARLLVLTGLLSAVTWAPGVLLFGIQAGMSGWAWFTENWTLGLALLAGFIAWILLVSLVALASSAYVRWRIIAGALVLGFFFVLAGAGKLVNVVLRVDWGSDLNPALAMYRIWCAMLGAELPEGPGAWESGAALAVLAGALCLVLERKLRPVEVIS